MRTNGRRVAVGPASVLVVNFGASSRRPRRTVRPAVRAQPRAGHGQADRHLRPNGHAGRGAALVDDVGARSRERGGARRRLDGVDRAPVTDVARPIQQLLQRRSRRLGRQVQRQLVPGLGPDDGRRSHGPAPGIGGPISVFV